jgi:glycosyltransferase involved in cell wall biosynthesis
MIRRPRVLLLIPHLGGGGAERVTALLARGLSRQKYDVHLALITESCTTAHNLPQAVTVHAQGARRVRTAAISLLRLVRGLKPDVILSSMAHLNFLVLLLRPFFPRGTRVLVRQNSTVSAVLASGALPVYTRLLYRHLYCRADRIICQTSPMAKDLARELRISDRQIIVLPNPIDIDAIRRTVAKPENQNLNPKSSSAGPQLLAVGRLSPEKGFDLLLRALATVRPQFPEVRLLIAGAGPEEAALKAESSRLGLEATVRFLGHVDHPSTYFPGTSVFVLSSRHEGMPNALLEAAAAGLPIVATPACDGIVDLLADRSGIWLADEVSSEALASTLFSALQLLQPGQRFPHGFIEEFRLERVVQAYEALIDSVPKVPQL